MNTLLLGCLGFFNAITCIAYAYLALYINKINTVESCNCSQNLEQKVLYISAIILAVTKLVWTFMIAKGKYVSNPVLKTVSVSITAVFIVSSYLYIKKLKEKCDCSNDMHIIFFYIIQFINGLIVTYGLFVIIFVIIGVTAIGYKFRKFIK